MKRKLSWKLFSEQSQGKKRTSLHLAHVGSRRKLNMRQTNWNCMGLRKSIVRNHLFSWLGFSYNLILDDLMRSMQQVKRILHAKWSKNGTETSTQQEDLTAEAERILKKTQTSKYYDHLPILLTIMCVFCRKQGVRQHYGLCQQDDCEVQLIKCKNLLWMIWSERFMLLLFMDINRGCENKIFVRKTILVQ